MVSEPSGLEPLKFYCSVFYGSLAELSSFLNCLLFMFAEILVGKRKHTTKGDPGMFFYRVKRWQ